MAQLINVRLTRPDGCPLGFRLQGGKDFGTPLVIQKVNGGSPAEKAGLVAGDSVIRVNNTDVYNLRHKDAQDVIIQSGQNFDLTIQRGGSTWKPAVTPVGSLPSPGRSLSSVSPVTQTSLKTAPQPAMHIGSGYNSAAKPFSYMNGSGDTVKSIVNKQYNTPVGMYSEETIAETLSAQAEVLAGGVLGVNFKKNEKTYDAQKSEVYKMLQEADNEPEPDACHFYATASRVRTASPLPVSPWPPRKGPRPPSRSSQGTQTPVPEPPTPPPVTFVVPPPPMPPGLYIADEGRISPAPNIIPQPTSDEPLGPVPDTPDCSECSKHIVGVFVRIKDKNLHVECFKCSTCGSSLKNQGYYNLNGKLYCDIHAKMVARQNPPAPGLEPVTFPTKPASTISSALSQHTMPLPPLSNPIHPSAGNGLSPIMNQNETNGSSPNISLELSQDCVDAFTNIVSFNGGDDEKSLLNPTTNLCQNERVVNNSNGHKDNITHDEWVNGSITPSNNNHELNINSNNLWINTNPFYQTNNVYKKVIPPHLGGNYKPTSNISGPKPFGAPMSPSMSSPSAMSPRAPISAPISPASTLSRPAQYQPSAAAPQSITGQFSTVKAAAPFKVKSVKNFVWPPKNPPEEQDENEQNNYMNVASQYPPQISDPASVSYRMESAPLPNPWLEKAACSDIDSYQNMNFADQMSQNQIQSFTSSINNQQQTSQMSMSSQQMSQMNHFMSQSSMMSAEQMSSSVQTSSVSSVCSVMKSSIQQGTAYSEKTMTLPAAGNMVAETGSTQTVAYNNNFVEEKVSTANPIECIKQNGLTQISQQSITSEENVVCKRNSLEGTEQVVTSKRSSIDESEQKVCSNINSTVDESERNITSKRNSIASVENNVPSKRNSIASVEQVAASKSNSVESFEQKVCSKRNSIESVEQPNISKRNSVESIEQKVCSKRNSIESVEQPNISKRNSVESIEPKVCSKRNSIESVEQPNISKRNSVESIEPKVCSKRNSIESVEQPNISKRNSIESIEPKVCSQRNSIASVEQLSASKSNSVESFEQKVCSKRNSIASVEQMAASKSNSIESFEQKVCSKGNSIASVEQMAASKSNSVESFEQKVCSKRNSIESVEQPNISKRNSVESIEPKVCSKRNSIESIEQPNISKRNSIESIEQNISSKRNSVDGMESFKQQIVSQSTIIAENSEEQQLSCEISNITRTKSPMECVEKISEVIESQQLVQAVVAKSETPKPLPSIPEQSVQNISAQPVQQECQTMKSETHGTSEDVAYYEQQLQIRKTGGQISPMLNALIIAPNRAYSPLPEATQAPAIYTTSTTSNIQTEHQVQNVINDEIVCNKKTTKVIKEETSEIQTSSQEKQSTETTVYEKKEYAHIPPIRPYTPVEKPVEKVVLPAESAPYIPPDIPFTIEKREPPVREGAVSPFVEALTIAPQRPFTPLSNAQYSNSQPPQQIERGSMLAALTIASDRPYSPLITTQPQQLHNLDSGINTIKTQPICPNTGNICVYPKECIKPVATQPCQTITQTSQAPVQSVCQLQTSTNSSAFKPVAKAIQTFPPPLPGEMAQAGTTYTGNQNLTYNSTSILKKEQSNQMYSQSIMGRNDAYQNFNVESKQMYNQAIMSQNVYEDSLRGEKLTSFNRKSASGLHSPSHIPCYQQHLEQLPSQRGQTPEITKERAVLQTPVHPNIAPQSMSPHSQIKYDFNQQNVNKVQEIQMVKQNVATPQYAPKDIIPEIRDLRKNTPISMTFQPVPESTLRATPTHIIRSRSATPGAGTNNPAPLIPYYQMNLIAVEHTAVQPNLYEPVSRSPTPKPNRTRSPAPGPPPNPMKSPMFKETVQSYPSQQATYGQSVNQCSIKNPQFQSGVEVFNSSGAKCWAQNQHSVIKSQQMSKSGYNSQTTSSGYHSQTTSSAVVSEASYYNQQQMQQATQTQQIFERRESSVQKTKKVFEEFERTQSAKTIEYKKTPQTVTSQQAAYNSNSNQNYIQNQPYYEPKPQPQPLHSTLPIVSFRPNLEAPTNPPIQANNWIKPQDTCGLPCSTSGANINTKGPVCDPTPSTGAGPAGGARGKTFGVSSAPKRGRGVLNKPAIPGSRVPLCAMCNANIRGPFISALGRIWCPEHFICANNTCRRHLQDIGFVEENGQLYCEYCFEQYIAPACDKCHGKIKGDCLNAIGKHFHPECFNCAYCGKLFGNNPFFLEEGLPYCEADWNELFTTKCIACGFPVEAGDRWVEALNNNYHSQCFNCTNGEQNIGCAKRISKDRVSTPKEEGHSASPMLVNNSTAYYQSASPAFNTNNTNLTYDFNKNIMADTHPSKKVYEEENITRAFCQNKSPVPYSNANTEHGFLAYSKPKSKSPYLDDREKISSSPYYGPSPKIVVQSNSITDFENHKSAQEQGLFDDIVSSSGKVLGKVTVDKISSSVFCNSAEEPVVMSDLDAIENDALIHRQEGSKSPHTITDSYRTETITNEDVLKIKLTPTLEEFDDYLLGKTTPRLSRSLTPHFGFQNKPQSSPNLMYRGDIVVEETNLLTQKSLQELDKLSPITCSIRTRAESALKEPFDVFNQTVSSNIPQTINTHFVDTKNSLIEPCKISTYSSSPINIFQTCNREVIENVKTCVEKEWITNMSYAEVLDKEQTRPRVESTGKEMFNNIILNPSPSLFTSHIRDEETRQRIFSTDFPQTLHINKPSEDVIIEKPQEITHKINCESSQESAATYNKNEQKEVIEKCSSNGKTSKKVKEQKLYSKIINMPVHYHAAIVCILLVLYNIAVAIYKEYEKEKSKNIPCEGKLS